MGQLFTFKGFTVFLYFGVGKLLISEVLWQEVHEFELT